MVTVVLDPGLLAFVPGTSRAALLAKIERIANWSKVSAAQSWLKLTLAPSARETLQAYAFIPAHESARLLLEETGLRHAFAPQDLIRPIYDLLEKAETTDYCCITDELHGDFESEPAQPWHGDHPGVEALSQHALLISSLENRVHQERRFSLFASTVASNTVKFSAQLELVSPDTVLGFGEHDLPQKLEDQIQHVLSVEDICANLDPSAIWADAKSSRDLKFAIQLVCRKRMMQQSEYEGLDKIPLFFVGNEFLQSLKAWQADGNNKYASQTLASCAAAVLELETIEIKPFKKARRAADLADPLRAHISESGVALRLMMWLRPGVNRCIEFANVGGKHEEEIAYSDPSSAV